MKKVLSIVLVLTMIAALATGCAKAPADNGGSTNLTGSLADIVDKIYAAHPVDLSLGTENVDITDTAWMLPQFTGLTSADGVKEAVVSEPMISSIAYSLVLVRVEDAKNAQSIAQQMKDGINPHKWVCVEADDLARPESTVPSTGIRPPERTMTVSPSRTSSTATSVSTPSRRTVAVLGLRSIRARIASPVLPLARVSRNLPRVMRVKIMEADSK